MIRLLLALTLSASGAAAQELPAAFGVTNVAKEDVLNIRAAPSARSAIIGTYAPDDLNIEVLSTSPDGKWGRVGVSEGNGWVAMRFLARSEDTPTDTLPRPLICSGTEPFWTLAMTPGGDEYLTPDDRRDLTLTAKVAAPQGYLVTFTEGATLTHTLIVQRGLCSDGMSDRDFGWRAMLFKQAPDGNTLAAGCCTLDAH